MNQSETEKLAKRVNDFLDEQATFNTYFVLLWLACSVMVLLALWLFL